jgi:hypothetical protein
VSRGRAAAVVAILVVFGVLATFTVREISMGARAIDDADAALARGDTRGAIAAARAAAEAVVPGSPYPARGYERLEGLARDAEGRGDDATALAAWQAMHAAALATEGPGVRTAAWRTEADEGIARVGSAHTGKPEPGRPSAEDLLASLQRSDIPTTGTFALLAAGAAAFFGGLVRLAWLAGKSGWRARARLPAVVMALGLVAYAFACWRG